MLHFLENEHFLHLDTSRYVCVSGSEKCLFFRKVGAIYFLFFFFFFFFFFFMQCSFSVWYILVQRLVQIMIRFIFQTYFLIS